MRLLPGLKIRQISSILGIALAIATVAAPSIANADPLPFCSDLSPGDSTTPCVSAIGELVLDLETTTAFEWRNRAGGASDIRQPIVERRCEIGFASEPLVTLSSPGSSSPGFNTTVGVFSGNNARNGRGTPCGQIESGQSLTIDLAGNLANAQVRRSVIDLQLKGDPEVEIRTYVDVAGTPTQTGRIRVRAGGTIDPTVGRNGLTSGQEATFVPEEGDAPVPAEIINCSGLSDSGADAGRDHCIVTFNNEWETMTISATGGAAGLAGGNDASISDSVSQISTFQLFQVADGILDCGDETDTVVNNDGTAAGTIRRLVENAGTAQECSQTCTAVPYTIEWAGSTLEFLAELGDQTCAAFEYNISFDPLVVSEGTPNDVQRPLDAAATAGTSAGDDERAVLISDFGRTATANIPLAVAQQFLSTDPEFAMDVCLGTPNYATSSDVPASAPSVGDLVSLMPPAIGFPDMSGDLTDGTQYGCWLDLRLRYGQDPVQPDSAETADRLWFLLRGYFQGDYGVRALSR